MTAADEVRRLCAVMWPGQKVDAHPEMRCYPMGGKRRPQYKVVGYVVIVGRSMLSHGTELGRGTNAAAAWDAALDLLPLRIAERVAEIDREAAALSEERARLACLTTGEGVQP